MELVFPSKEDEQWVSCPKACPDEHGCRFRARIKWDEYDVRDKQNKCWTYARNLVFELLPPEGSEKCKPFFYLWNPEHKFRRTPKDIQADPHHREYDGQEFSFTIEPGSDRVVVTPEDVGAQWKKDAEKDDQQPSDPPPWDYQSWDGDFHEVKDKTKGNVFRLSTSPGIGFSEFRVLLLASGLCGCVGQSKDSTDESQVKGRDVGVDYKFGKKPC
jgi:hypothetical protein